MLQGSQPFFTGGHSTTYIDASRHREEAIAADPANARSQSVKKDYERGKMVARDRIELPTRGFSVRRYDYLSIFFNKLPGRPLLFFTAQCITLRN